MRFISADRLRDVARSAFWLVPAACAAAAIGLGVGLIFVDQQLGQFRAVFLFPGGPDGARSLLSSIVQAMIAFTGLVFSITIVVLQLTSSQFSPRVLRSFLQDRVIQFALGTFVATFVYGMVVLRAVRSGAEVFVPRIAVTMTFALVLVSVGLFIAYISHMANMIRLASIVDAIGEDARALIERRHPRDAPPPPPLPPLPPARRIVPAPAPGVLVSVNEPGLVACAAAADGVVELLLRIGDFVPAGGSVLRLRGDGNITDEQLTGQLAFDIERTMQQDVAFAFRQLVDIAQKALSPGINDPTTATQAIDVIHDLLRRLATRELASGAHRDADGTLRLLVPQWSFAELLDLSVGQIWHYAADAAQVPERLAGMLDDVASVARASERPAVDRWLRIVRPAAAAERAG